MDTNNPNYQDRISELEQNKSNQEIKHTVYLSRRAIWANVLLSLFSPIAGYIHTRRWKELGIIMLCSFVFFVATDNGEGGFEEGLKRGQNLSPLFSLIAMIDNGIAINNAKEKVNN